MWTGNLKLAIKSLRQSKWRSLLTMLGIIIGVSSVITVVSLGQGLKHQVVGQINQLGSDVITVRPGKLITNNGNQTSLNYLAFLSASTLTSKDVDTVAALPSVKTAAPFNFVTNAVKADGAHMDNVYVIGTSPNLNDILREKISYGSFLDADSIQNSVVVGSDVAHTLFGEFNPVGHSLDINGQTFIVHGVLAPTTGGILSIAQTDFNSALFIPTLAAQDLTGNHTNILQILVKARDPTSVNQTINDVHAAIFKNHGVDDFSVLRQDQLIQLTSGVANTVAAFISGIAAVSLLVGGIGIMDIMLVSVSERTREIGLRKALGATNRQIRNQFVVEGSVLTIAGGLLGILLSLLINFLLQVYTNLHPVLDWKIMLLAVGVSVGVGLIFSTVPAVKAARKDPIAALRGD